MDTSTPFKWAPFRSRQYFTLRALVLTVFAQLSGPRRDDAGARSARRSHDHLPLGEAATPPNWTNAAGRISAACNDSWRVDETSVKIKKIWMSLSRAVDSEGIKYG